MEKIPTRDEALLLLKEYTKNESLLKHAFTVESIMREAAKRINEDEHKWAVTGLLHDFDYEKYPAAPDHPLKGAEILREKGISEEIVEAILGHATYSNVPRKSEMAKWLYAVDELSGFVTACALVRPNFLNDLESRSVKKKLKDKAFAKSVSREDIQKGVEELGLNMDDHITFVINAIKQNTKEIGF